MHFTITLFQIFNFLILIIHYGLFIYLLITVISLNKRVRFLEKQIKNNKN